MIGVWVEDPSVGPTGMWYFEAIPRVGEHVNFRPLGLYLVTRVIHWPIDPELSNHENHTNKSGIRVLVERVGEFGSDMTDTEIAEIRKVSG